MITNSEADKELKYENKIITKENEALEEILERSLKQIRLLESEITRLKTEITRLKTEITRLKTEITRLKTELQNKIIKLEEENFKLKNENKLLEKSLQDAQQYIIAIHQSLTFRLLRIYDNSVGKVFPIRFKKYSKPTQKQVSLTQQQSTFNDALEITLKNKDIFYFPIINWDFRFQRSHHIARQFAEKGHRVFYFTVNLRTNKKPYFLKKLETNIFEVSLSASKFFDIYKDEFNSSNLNSVMKNLQVLQKDLKIDPLCIVSFPSWAPLAFRVNELF